MNFDQKPCAKRPGVSLRKKISLSERHWVVFRVLCEEEKAAIAALVSERKEKHSSRKASDYPPSEKTAARTPKSPRKLPTVDAFLPGRALFVAHGGKTDSQKTEKGSVINNNCVWRSVWACMCVYGGSTQREALAGRLAFPRLTDWLTLGRAKRLRTPWLRRPITAVVGLKVSPKIIGTERVILLHYSPIAKPN